MAKSNKIVVTTSFNMSEYHCACGYFVLTQSRTLNLIKRLHEKKNPDCRKIKICEKNIEDRVVNADR